MQVAFPNRFLQRTGYRALSLTRCSTWRFIVFFAGVLTLFSWGYCPHFCDSCYAQSTSQSNTDNSGSVSDINSQKTNSATVSENDQKTKTESVSPSPNAPMPDSEPTTNSGTVSNNKNDNSASTAATFASTDKTDVKEPLQPGIRKIFEIPPELTPEGRSEMYQTLSVLNPEPVSDTLNATKTLTTISGVGNVTERSYNLASRLMFPSLVHIETVSSRSRPGKESPAGYSVELNNESGAGFIITHKGKYYVVTNAHVIRAGVNGISNAGISLYLYDGNRIQPKQVWKDTASDIAVMEIEGIYWPVRWGDASTVRTGNYILAMGSPFGLRNCCSSGIVSAVGRRNLEVGRTDKRLQDFIQTDAVIHPGNSGGPLVNLRGEVIGMNSAIASNSGFGEGVSFTIPVRLLLCVVDQLIETGQVQYGYIGATFEKNYSVHLAVQMGVFDALGMKSLPILPNRVGAMIAEVFPGSSAARSMLRSGDIILYYDDSIVEDYNHLQFLIHTTPVGKRVSIAFYRGGKLFEHVIVVQAAPAS